MQHGARRVLDAGGAATLAGRRRCTRSTPMRSNCNVSPGGAADLLAATLFLDRIGNVSTRDRASIFLRGLHGKASTSNSRAGQPAAGRALVGVVGSGDLEVLLEPAPAGLHHGTSHDLRRRLRRRSGKPCSTASSATVGPLPGGALEINDFGATPGVVRMRIGQAFGALGADAGAAS